MDKQLLEEEYIINNKGLKSISKLYNINYRQVKKLLMKYDIPLKKRGGYIKYFYNEDYFDIWSHDMAYIIGFISADGHIRKNTADLEIGLNPIDIDILKFIINKVSINGEIRYRDKECVRIIVRSQKIIDSLAKYNITNNKTHNLKIDFNIPDEFWGDYLRGFFDGDGSVYLVQDKNYKKKKKYYIWSEISCASKQFLVDVQNRLGFGYVRNKQNNYSLDFRHHNTIKLRDILYKNIQSFALQRKKDKFYANV